MMGFKTQVLIACNKEDRCRQYADALENHGFGVGLARSSLEFSATLEKHSYQFVLLDAELSGAPVTQLLSTIEQNTPDLPVVIFANGWSEALSMSALQLGARGYLGKAPTPAQLIELINKILEEKSRRERRIVQRLDTSSELEEQKRENQALERALEEKNVLIKEMHHRVKNNLFVISQLLSMCLDRLHDQESRRVLEDCKNRIYVMARAHQQLLQSDEQSEVAMATYLPRLVRQVGQAYGASDQLFVVEICDVNLSMNLANACGLIVNELVTNALWHAFPPEFNNHECHEIRVILERRSDKLRLGISDNGVGISERDDPAENVCMGLELVTVLVEQLDGKMHIDSQYGRGTTYHITFSSKKE